MNLMTALGHALWMAFVMLWETLWALVLGFVISAALQVLTSKEQMTRAFGATNFRTMLLATGFGAASSSCSYAAVAAGRSAFQQGAALVPVLAFMFASTNLVVELAAMIWVLLGWNFVLAEVIGAFVLIGLMWLFASRIFSRGLEEQARANAQAAPIMTGHCCGNGGNSSIEGPNRLSRLANAFVMDWLMIWKELVAGFLVAGFLSALVPASWWKALFIETGPTWLRLIENAAVGPIIGMLSWVCSCANIPLASLLWSNGISFGGVIAFIYADLLVVPILLIYGKYFGGRAALYIALIFYLSMVGAGVIVDLVFAGAGWIPQGTRPPSTLEHAMIVWNYTTWLDLIAIAVAVWLFVVKTKQSRGLL
ncbi:MAG: permease [Chthoniobacterales bacterium]